MIMIDRILLFKPKMSGRETDFIKTVLAEDWAVPLGPDCDTFEHELETLLVKIKRWQRLSQALLLCI